MNIPNKKRGSEMEVGSSSSTESANCVICGKRSGNYKTYRQYGIKLYIPLCSEECYKFSANSEFDEISKKIREKAKK